ncbi:MAG: hypothetical protein CBE34_00315 [bacterium TMED274]|nr:MAG: hypothetical protein CBE34_00315 [bacterium TMED274]RCL91238.1 MAG: NAD+ synthase [bacterium]
MNNGSKKLSKSIKVGICQINPKLGNFDYNYQKLLENYNEALDKGANLVVFPEMVTTGYPPQDLLFSKSFVKKNLEVINNFSKKVSSPCIVGFIDEKNGNLFNAAAVCEEGKIVKVYHKILLPNYDVFDENRYFENGSQIGDFKINVNGENFDCIVQICEDLWEDNYDRKLSEEIVSMSPDLIINISASPYHKNRKNIRKDLIMKKFSDAKCSFIYCNLVGGQDELIFDGNSMVFNSDMNLIAEGKSFEEDLVIVDMNSKPINNRNLDINSDIYNALTLGIKDYFSKTGHKKAVIGLSGGIDSALVACLAVDALGSDNVYLVSMPSRFSSEHSKADAKNLANNLNAHFDTVDIDSLFESYLEVLNPKFKGLESNVAEENIQSRIRGNILMAFSNKFGCLVLSTGNKTELALGYCTLYGDMSGGLSAIGDLSKTEVYNLAKWKNKISNNVIPESSITKPPSAELAPNQVDPFDYDLISPVVDKIVLGEDLSKDMSRNPDLADIALRINRNEHKRRQAAPVLRISKKAFGMGRRIPIVNHFDE